MGKEYITEPMTIPVRPWMPSVSPSHLVRMPLLPSSRVRPQPWEMEGMSIGRVRITLNIFFRRILLRAIQ